MTAIERLDEIVAGIGFTALDGRLEALLEQALKQDVYDGSMRGFNSDGYGRGLCARCPAQQRNQQLKAMAAMLDSGLLTDLSLCIDNAHLVLVARAIYAHVRTELLAIHDASWYDSARPAVVNVTAVVVLKARTLHGTCRRSFDGSGFADMEAFGTSDRNSANPASETMSPDLIQQHLRFGGEEQDCLAHPSIASAGVQAQPGATGGDRKLIEGGHLSTVVEIPAVQKRAGSVRTRLGRAQLGQACLESGPSGEPGVEHGGV